MAQNFTFIAAFSDSKELYKCGKKSDRNAFKSVHVFRPESETFDSIKVGHDLKGYFKST